MKGSLVKREDRWDLYNLSDGSKIASTAPNPFGKLSITNCEAITTGYNVNELADKYYGPGDYGLEIKTGFIKGFEVAMRLMGDKKFSEEDMVQAFLKGVSLQVDTPTFQQSLQQTEWDVDIEMEEVAIGDKYTPEPKPKLDADGCLILKRV